MPQVDINYWAIIVSAIASMALGFVWYLPGVFGKSWMKLIGKTTTNLEKDVAARGYLTSLVGSLIMVYVSRHILAYAGADTPMEAIITAFWVWLGFVATTSWNEVSYGGRPAKYWLLTNGYQLLSLIIISLILTLWQ